MFNLTWGQLRAKWRQQRKARKAREKKRRRMRAILKAIAIARKGILYSYFFFIAIFTIVLSIVTLWHLWDFCKPYFQRLYNYIFTKQEKSSSSTSSSLNENKKIDV